MTGTTQALRISQRAFWLGLALASAALLSVACAPSGASERDSTARGVDGAESGLLEGRVTDATTGDAIAGAVISVEGARPRATSARDGGFRLEGLAGGTWRVTCRAQGYRSTTLSGIKIHGGRSTTLDFALKPQFDLKAPETDVISSRHPTGAAQVETEPLRLPPSHRTVPKSKAALSTAMRLHVPMPISEFPRPAFDTEAYDPIDENRFYSALDEPLSTFSIDVDTASYANMRRFIEKEHRLPPIDAVRIEELINYFTYSYPDPAGDEPFSITTEVAAAPWNPKHRLVHIGLQGRRVDTEELPPNNLVFLLDVSGSMNTPAKLPLLKSAFRLLVENLREQDRVAIVVYAGAAGLVLPPTPGSDKDSILRALDSLRAGGSTAGGAGLRLAYQTARENFDPEANNRVILATDGDFNVGASSDAEMVRLIERQRASGVFLSVLGFGAGNYKDSKMEKLADHGNGSAAYIDSILEAKKVLVSEMGGTLFTIAKDVKIQVEFNPAWVKGYRLVGYENRRLAHQDFNDDTKDAGELGAGHSVTVLYEIVPADSDEELAGIDDLKYQESRLRREARRSGELLTVKLRYKAPDSDTSQLVSRSLEDRRIPLARASDDFRFSAAVAEFGMLLRDSQWKAEASYDSVLRAARSALASDDGGYRAEFLELAEQAKLLDTRG